MFILLWSGIGSQPRRIACLLGTIRGELFIRSCSKCHMHAYIDIDTCWAAGSRNVQTFHGVYMYMYI